MHDGHTHHTHSHDVQALNGDKAKALLAYMLDHNRHHADELNNTAHALEADGNNDAAYALKEAVHYFDHGNEKLAEALSLLERS